MEIKKLLKKKGILAGNDIEGASYISDKAGNLIGWVDFESEIIFIEKNYPFWKNIVKICFDLDFNFSECEIKEKPVIDFYSKRKKMITKIRNRRKGNKNG